MFNDYCWKDGLPYGINGSGGPFSYKIVQDPYRKWVSIEQYSGPKFIKVIYDSRLIDFRKLHPSEQLGWERETYSETEHEMVQFIRNQDDRLVYRETSFFSNLRCMSAISTPPMVFSVDPQAKLYR